MTKKIEEETSPGPTLADVLTIITNGVALMPEERAQINTYIAGLTTADAP